MSLKLAWPPDLGWPCGRGRGRPRPLGTPRLAHSRIPKTPDRKQAGAGDGDRTGVRVKGVIRVGTAEEAFRHRVEIGKSIGVAAKAVDVAAASYPGYGGVLTTGDGQWPG